MYGTILLIVHILGAIAGIGPTFAFGLLGGNAGKDPAGAVYYLSALMDIEKKIVTPVALFTQPLSGILLIFHFGYNQDFFTRIWLVISIVAFATILTLSYGVNNPALHRIIHAMKAGEAGTPAFQKDLKTMKGLGPLFGVLTLVIIVLMVWKPTL